MDKDRNFRKMYAEHLQSMVYSKTLDASAVPELIKFIDEAFTNWEKSLVDELGQKAKTWETAMGDDDKSLYTLGIRHSIDAIKGVPKNEYQPIGEDFRGTKN
jgi:phage terminase large subunit-like protein